MLYRMSKIALLAAILSASGCCLFFPPMGGHGGPGGGGHGGGPGGPGQFEQRGPGPR